MQERLYTSWLQMCTKVLFQAICGIITGDLHEPWKMRAGPLKMTSMLRNQFKTGNLLSGNQLSTNFAIRKFFRMHIAVIKSADSVCVMQRNITNAS